LDLLKARAAKATCWDNALAEFCFKTFKAKLPIEPIHCNYNSLRGGVIFTFIEIWRSILRWTIARRRECKII